MKLENQVCTLEQAIKFFDLGIDLLSHFAWCWNGIAKRNDGTADYFLNKHGFDREWEGGAYCAFTVAELGVMLPLYYQSWHGNNEMGEMGWIVKSMDGEWDEATVVYQSEAQARAAMLIYLLENNIITAEEVNNRLLSA